MNERVKDEQHSPRIASVDGTVGESLRLESSGVDIRIDSAHSRGFELESREVEWPVFDHFVRDHRTDAVPVRPSHSVVAPAISDLSGADTQFLDGIGLRAKQLQIQLQSQKQNLDQRENELRIQLEKLDGERRQFVHRVASDQTQLDSRRREQQKNEAELAERLLAVESQHRKLETEREILAHQRKELDQRKNTVRDEVLAELQSSRSELDHARTTFQKDLDHAQTLKEALQARLDTLSVENERILKIEREKLWQSLTQEWEQKKHLFDQERETWTRFRDLEKSELDREKAMFEAAVESANNEFVKSRESVAIELNQLREQQAIRLDFEAREWERKRALEVAELEARQAAQLAEYRELKEAVSRELTNLREQNDLDIQAESNAWQQARTRDELELQLARESLERELAEAREKNAIEIDAKRQEWHDTHARELALIESQQSEMHAARNAFELELAELSESQAASFLAKKSDWEQTLDQERSAWETERAEILASIDALKSELVNLRQQHDEAIASERTDWELQRAQEELLRNAQHAEWLASRDTVLQASRDALEVEFIGLREQHSATLAAEREEWEQSRNLEKQKLDERHNELIRESTTIENRIRFQQDHLDKARAEFEEHQNEYRRERQVELQRLEENGMLMIRRLQQIDLYRASIDAREKSLDREHEIFGRMRKAISNTADLDRANFQADRHAWDQERQIQQNELRRQQEALTARSDSLESRRIRLDKLRTELEETHRATLEMRLALEEAWAQLTHVAGQDEARQRVEQVRQSLMDYYQQMHETLSEQRREHFEAQSKFERQRAEFTEERQRLTGWLTTRDEELRVGEERLHLAAAESATNHTKWLTARDRWLLEKTEAEQLIRRLLTSLGENNRDESGEAAITMADLMRQASISE